MTPLSERLRVTLRQDVQSMQAYAIQDSRGMVKLDAMENPFPLPPELQRALGERLGRVAINRYPAQCAADVVAALSRHIGLPEGCALMLGNGSDELIDLLSVACDLPGATILAPVPGFVMYEMSAKLRGLGFVGVPLRPDFELDETAMLEAIERHRPALTYIAYPNNPTANLFDDAAIDLVVAAVGAQQGLVVMDEAYRPFSSRTWMQKMASRPHVMVLRSERTRLQRELAAMPGVQPFPSEANMILVRVPDSARAFAGMKARGVLVKHIAPLHPLLSNCLRLTVGSPQENDRMLQALRESV